MHIQLSLILALLCTTLAWAKPPHKEIKQLFAKYDMIVHGNKGVNFADVFTTSFLKEAGGEKSLLDGWEKEKKMTYELIIKPSRTNRNRAYVQRVPAGSKRKPHSSFVVVKEQGKWRIEGNIEDE